MTESDKKETKPDGDDEARGGFGNAFEYFLANLGMTVGLGKPD